MYWGTAVTRLSRVYMYRPVIGAHTHTAIGATRPQLHVQIRAHSLTGAKTSAARPKQEQ